jgi:membrane protein YqaA with SNARE-associated domain
LTHEPPRGVALTVPTRTRAAESALVFVWAYAEATLFVLVPDVPISFLTVRSGWRAGLTAALVAAVGAALGGLTTYLWAVHAPDAARAAIVSLPGIDAALVARAEHAFAADGYAAMLGGSFGGIPYKLYALAAGVQQRPLAQFLLLSPLIRLPRFLMTVLLASLATKLGTRRLATRTCLWLLAAFWVIFYAAYFAVMPG